MTSVFKSLARATRGDTFADLPIDCEEDRDVWRSGYGIRLKV